MGWLALPMAPDQYARVRVVAARHWPTISPLAQARSRSFFAEAMERFNVGKVFILLLYSRRHGFRIILG